MTTPRRWPSVIATMLGVGAMLLVSGCTTGPPPPLPMSTAAQPCPQWADYPRNIHSGRNSPFLGCTTNYNLQAMVANPEDLVHGRPLGPADGEREACAVQAYRLGEVKPFVPSRGPGASSSTSVGAGPNPTAFKCGAGTAASGGSSGAPGSVATVNLVSGPPTSGTTGP